MDTLASLRGKIPDFTGYLNEDDRRRSDELVRSHVGEALSDLQSRISPGVPDSRFERVLMRCGFANQTAFKAFEYMVLGEERVDAIRTCDLKLLDLADRLPEVPPDGADRALAEIMAAFDERDRAMEVTSA